MSESNVVFYGGDGRTVATFTLSAGTSYSCDVPRWAQRMVLYVAEPPPPLPPPVPPGFLAHVLSWLREALDENAAEVTAVTNYGTDWAGDTAGGFYSEHEFTVKWVDADGKAHERYLVGEQLVDLWDHVVNSWPGDREAV